MTIPLASRPASSPPADRDKLADRSIVTLGLASSSIPDFVSGVILQVRHRRASSGWFHVLAQRARRVRLPHPARATCTLPALALVVVYFGYIARMTRAGVIQALDADYTRTATMKGLSEPQVMRRHVLRNGCSRRSSVIGVQIGYLFGSLVALEMIFNYPGLGSTIFNAASTKDLPVLSAGVLLVGIIYMLCHAGRRPDHRLDEPAGPARR